MSVKMDAKLKSSLTVYFYTNYKWVYHLTKRKNKKSWEDFLKLKFCAEVSEMIDYTLENAGPVVIQGQLLLENSIFGIEWERILSGIDRLLDGGETSVVEAWKLWKRFVKNGQYDIEAALNEQRRIKQNDNSVKWTLKFVHIALQPEEEYVPGRAYGDAKKRTMETMEI